MGDVDGEDGDEVGEGGSEEEEQGDSEGGSVDQTVMVCYRRGVYLDPDATLKDLRNAFLDSGIRFLYALIMYISELFLCRTTGRRKQIPPIPEIRCSWRHNRHRDRR